MNAPHHLPEEDARSRRGSARSGDRLRWGLTGLGAIMLIVMIAAAGARPTGREPQPGAGEPLAVLGVAPGPATKADEAGGPPRPAPAN